MDNIVFVNFECNETIKSVPKKIWQYGYGQILRIQGLNLPSAVEIHFSLQKSGGVAERRIGVTRDGVTDVVIPDFILKGKGIERDYYAYAFIYLSNEESGQTEHRIELSIISRPEPEGSTGSDETNFGAIMDAIKTFAAGKADGLKYENNILKLMSGEAELARVTIKAGEGTGSDAREIELQKSDTAIQWRYVGDEEWTDLVLLEELKGDPGEGVSNEKIQEAVNTYLKENPIEVEVDAELSKVSTNPIQNAAVAKEFSRLSDTITDKATLENNTMKFFKSGETDKELFSVDLSELSAGLDLANLTMTVTSTENGNCLSLSDGTTTKSVDIPAVSVTDEQIESLVNTWLNEHPEATTTISYSYNERGSFLTVEDDGSVVTERVFDKYANGYTKNLFTDYTFTRITGVENASYITSDFIKVVKGVPYCASRKTTSVYTYDSSKNVLATTGIALNTTGIIFNDDVAYIRVEFFYQSAYTYAVQMGETYEIKYPDSYVPEYSVNPNFDKMLDTQVSKRLKRNAIRDFGRYGGDIDLNQYTRMFNYTTSSTNVELIDITDDSDWYGFGVRQVARLTHISNSTANFGFWFCKSSGVESLIPSEHGFAVGDTMYIGFIGRANRVILPMNNMSTAEKNTIMYIKDYTQIVMNTVPHFYEYAIPITEENIDSVLAIAFLLPPNDEDWIEITNLYMSNKSNVNKCIFEDLARKEVVDKIISYKFKDKTWLALGDSITNQGKYITALQKYFPFGTIDNQGIGGSTILDLDGNANSGSNLIDTLEENVKKAHVISIGYGTNDTNYIKKKATWSVGSLNVEDSNFDKTTFYGAYQYTIEKILSWNPTVPIVLIVPTVAMIVDSTTMTNTQKRELRDSVAQAVRDVANFYGYPYVDLYHDSGMNEFNRLTYAPDGVHPNDEFGEISARLMIPVFEYMKV